jgi:AcrR family transcriptional regulator
VADASRPRVRAGYHHGALREALVTAGLELSRAAGADAIVLREATRRAGVTARAAYRHFADRDALVHAVARAALAGMAAHIERSQHEAATGAQLLRGVGLGYIAFALDEPGWFDAAVLAMPDMLGGPVSVPDAAGPVGGAVYGPTARSPYRLLAAALAALVGEGRLAADQVTDAAIACWSGVHGFALLATRGPLRQTPRSALDAQATRLVDTLVAAVSGGGR